MASIVDGIILMFVELALFSILGLLPWWLMNFSYLGAAPWWFVGWSSWPYTLPLVLSLLVSWLYFAGFECSSAQATPGKMALGLVVTNLNRERISFGRAAARYFCKFLSELILYIGYLMIGFTAKKQGLHDMIAGTLVLKKGA
jgi:uncharacterized RDD family membrane protein YckC